MSTPVVLDTKTEASHGTYIDGFTNTRKYGITEADFAASAVHEKYYPTCFIRTNFIHVSSISDNVYTTSITTYNSSYVDGGFNSFGDGAELNSIILSRGGVYGASSWKQLDYHNNHPVIAYQKRNNILSHDGVEYNEPAVDTSDGCVSEIIVPLEYDESLEREEGTGFIIEGDPAVITSSFGNDITFFANEALNNASGVARESKSSPSFEATKQLFNPDLKANMVSANVNVSPVVVETEELEYAGNPETIKTIKKSLRADSSLKKGKFKLKELKFSERIYPKRKNYGRRIYRTRTNWGDITAYLFNYQEFWKDLIAEQVRVGFAGNTYNSQGYLQATTDRTSAFNVWPLVTGVESDIECYHAKYHHAWPASPSVASSYASSDYQSGELAVKPYYSASDFIGADEVEVEHPSPTYTIGGHRTAHALYNSKSFVSTSYPRAYTSGNRIYNLRYRIPMQTNKTPWYDSYSDYSKDLLVVDKEANLVPEFRISNHVEFYLQHGVKGTLKREMFTDQGGTTVEAESDYNYGFLEIVGAEDAVSGSASTGFDADFMNNFVYSDSIKALKAMREKVGDVTKPSSVRFKVDVTKKLLPHRGFFPVDRTMQISELFQRSYYDSVFWYNFTTALLDVNKSSSQGALKAWQTFLYHFMSPGLLYNSIKSGIGVGFPTYADFRYGNKGVYRPYFRYIDASLSPVTTHANADDKILNIISVPSFYLPFESLINVRKNMFRPVNIGDGGALSNNNRQGLLYLPDTFENYEDVSSGIDSVVMNCLFNQKKSIPYFDLAMNNFLAETVRFFLDKEQTTSFVSGPESKFKPMTAGSIYYMDVVLKSENIVLCEGCKEDPDNTHGWNQRGSLYGFPIEFLTNVQPNINSSADLSAASSNVRDPAYGPWTPPYFYGNSVARISFDPMEADSNLVLGDSKRFTLDEILRISEMRTLQKTNVGGEKIDEIVSGTTWAHTAYPGWDMDVDGFNGLYNEIDWLDYGGDPSTANTFSQYIYDEDGNETQQLDPFGSPILTAGMMPINQSVNLFGKKEYSSVSYERLSNKGNLGKSVREDDGANKDRFWVVSTKWETPVLDFSGHITDGSDDTRCSMPWTDDEFDNAGLDREVGMRARGMWMDYGVIPDPEKSGLFLELRESFPNRKLQNKQIVDFDGVGIVPSSDKGYGNSIPATVYQHSDSDGRKYESLIDVCNFKTGQKAVGEIAESRKVYEGIMVIPFVERNGKPRFFSVDKDILEKQKQSKMTSGYAHELLNGKKVVDTSITKTLDMMEKFVVPPQFDYAHYDHIEPFVAYILESSIEFGKQDLADIWQNVLPDVAQRAEKEHVEIGHRLEEYEFFHGEEIPSDVRFMTFKVKQRASWNYYESLPTYDKTREMKYLIFDEKGESSEIAPKVNYNWPYDFMSIIENAKLDIEFGFEGV